MLSFFNYAMKLLFVKKKIFTSFVTYLLVDLKSLWCWTEFCQNLPPHGGTHK